MAARGGAGVFEAAARRIDASENGNCSKDAAEERWKSEWGVVMGSF